ncbi:MAG: FAD-binding oxidoreductase [Promethearchaeati archaeon SRVP18_Atabeyarchaeia-1]
MSSDKSSASRLETVKKYLIGIVGEGNLSDAEFDKISYSKDTWPLRLMEVKRGVTQPYPDFIVWPESIDQIVKIVKLANDKKIPVIPYGGGAGVTGGTVPIHGGITIDLKKLDKILEIDEKSATVTVQPGIIGQDLENELNKRGYTFPHQPASMYCSSVGGFVACRSAGTFSSKYGRVEDMVVSLEAILPTGEIIRTRKVPKSSVGPNLNQILVGSEGTLGIITELTLKIMPIPEERRFRGFLLPTLHSGLEAVRKLYRRGVIPCLIRLYDETDAMLVLGMVKIPRKNCFLIVGFEGPKELVEVEEKLATKICEEEGGKDLGRDEAEKWWTKRFNMYYPNPVYAKMHMLADTIDVGATYDKLEELYYNVKKTVEKSGRVQAMAHFSHFYPEGGSIYMIFVLTEPDDIRAEEIYKRCWDEGMKAAIESGGTMSHHHSIGLLKGKWLEAELGSSYALLKTLKKALDPNNIMNPGKLSL